MNKKIIKLIIIIITLIFISSYLIADSGYYEYTIKQKTTITNEKIKEFEEDIKKEVNIDIKDYLNEDKIDYTNKFTSLVYNVSNNSNKIVKKAIKYVFKKLGTLVED